MSSRVKELVEIDLLQSARSSGSDKMKKKFTKKNVFMKMIGFQLWFILFFAFLILSKAEGIGFYENVEFFLVSAMSTLVMSLVITVMNVYQSFMGKMSFESYLPLPYSSKELFVSKMISVMISSSFTYLAFTFVLLATGISAGRGWIYSTLTSFLITGIVFMVSFFLVLGLMHFILNLNFVQKHRKVLKNIFLGLVFLNMIVVNVDELGNKFGFIYEKVLDFISPAFDCFRMIYVPGSIKSGWIGVAGWALGAVLLGLWVFKGVVPKLLLKGDQVSQATGKVKSQELTKNKRSESNLVSFIKYQVKLLNDGNLFFSIIISKAYFPLIAMLPNVQEKDVLITSLINFEWSELGLYLVVGFVIGMISVLENSVSSMIISLEGSNYNYIKTLPFSLEDYLRDKFKFAFIFDWLFGVIPYIPFVFMLDIPLDMVLAALAGYSVSIYIISFSQYRRDWETLFLDWKESRELLNRNGNANARLLTSLLVLAVGLVTAIMVGYYILNANLQGQWIMSMAILFGFGLWGVTVYQQGEKDFWPNVISEPVYYETEKTNQEIRADFKKHFYFPKRKLNGVDNFLLIITSRMVLEFLVGFVVARFVGENITPEESSRIGDNIISWVGLFSLVSTFMVMYAAKMPIINYKQVPRSEWKIIPGLTKKDWEFLVKYIPTSYVLRLASCALVERLIGINETMPEIDLSDLPKLSELTMTYEFWLIAFVIVIVAPITEEYLFRGLIMFRNPDKEPTWLATVVSSALFALAHLPRSWYVFYVYFSMGLVFSYAAKKTKSVEAGIVYHIINNIIALCLDVYGYSLL